MSTRIWHLLGRKLSGEASIDELRELEVLLLTNPELASKIEIHEQYFKTTTTANNLNSADFAWKRIELELSKENSHRPEKKERVFIKRNFLVAASIAILLVATAFLIYNVPASKTVKNLSRQQAGIVETNDNEKTEIVLPDGTNVWLNKNSRISYNKDFGKSNRDITLQGEAFFDVFHKAELPMVVHAGKIDVKVKGTAFNVKYYPDDKTIETSLIRGSIELVAKNGKAEQKILLKPNEKAIMYVNDGQIKNSILADKILLTENLAVEENSGLIPEVAWIKGLLVFNKEKLSVLAERMGKWYGVEITVDSGLANEKFTGVFKEEKLEEALNALQFTYDFKYSIHQNKISITKK